MNEYTRREEIRWTLVTVIVLVPAVAAAIIKLVLAQGPLITDPAALRAEQQQQQLMAQFKPCPAAAKTLAKELPFFLRRARKAKSEADAANKKKRRRDPEVKPKFSWASSAPVLRQSKVLASANCQAQTMSAAGTRAESAKAWTAIASVAKLPDPKKDAKRRQQIAGKLFAAYDGATIDTVTKHTVDAEVALSQALAKAVETRKTSKKRVPVAEGLFPRGAAIGVGVGVALAALIISYLSVRSASMQRARILVALRRFANTPEAGLQAAAIVRLGAHHNGGEPGMVVGAALGGLLAALLANGEDPNTFIADLFVAGAMGGLLIGLAGQWVVRTLSGLNRWRERTRELGDIEKPTIPVALILGGVTEGLENQFMGYFEALPMADAAVVVQKLAAQAEEKILAQAEAAHGGGMPPQGPGMM